MALHSISISNTSRSIDLISISRDSYRPRYWVTVWMTLKCGEFRETTIRKKLYAIEGLYQTASDQIRLDDVQFDTVMWRLNFPVIEKVLGAYRQIVFNASVQNGRDSSERWNTAYDFVMSVLEWSASDPDLSYNLTELQKKIIRLSKAYSRFHLPRGSKRFRLRALPSPVIEDIVEIVSPLSERNPFRTERGKWRNFVLIMLLLRLGLRRSEALLLPSNAVKSEHDIERGQVRYWVNVGYDVDLEEMDTRSERPSIKNDFSQRQLPLSADLAEIVAAYADNWRGRQEHGFLFSNSRGTPLSNRYTADIFKAVTRSLSDDARQALKDGMRSPSVTAHDLRHTCAVVRLTQFLATGHSMPSAMERLRVFFGWSPTSDMPRHYARAYFEGQLPRDIASDFNDHLHVLRASLRSSMVDE